MKKSARSLIFCTLISGFLSGCASFESRFTSQTGCPEEEIRVIKKTHNLFGNQSYTVSCRNVTFHCTESFIEKQYSNLKCAADSKRKRRPSSEVDGVTAP